MKYYSYDNFKTDIQLLRKECEPFNADTVLAIARGGLSVAHALSMALDIRNLQSIRCESYDADTQREHITIIGEPDLSAASRVLIVDDIVDSGKTLYALLPLLHVRYPHITFATVSIFTKKTALIQPEYSLYEADQWIEFYWERDFLKEGSL